MCGIFFYCDKNFDNFYKVKNNLNHITDSLRKRGPDQFISNDGLISGSYWIGLNTVLSIRTSKKNLSPALIKANKSGFFAYNGETYEPGTESLDDTEYLYKLICNEPNLYKDKHYQGYFAFAKLNLENLSFGVDFLSEKPLFYWKSNTRFCLSSDLRTILLLKKELGEDSKLNINKCKEYFLTRHLIQFNQTIYENIYRCMPGSQYSYNLSKHILEAPSLRENIINSRKHLLNNFCENKEDLLSITLEYIKSSLIDLKGRNDVGYIVSGGVDSTLISLFAFKNFYKKSNDEINYLTLTFGNKDLPSKLAKDLTINSSKNHKIINVSKKEYLKNLNYLYKNMSIPMPTHSFPSYSLLCENARKQNFRILVGGEGADEIYNGYELYKNIREDNSSVYGSLSPYSSLNDKYKLFGEELNFLQNSSDLYNAFKIINKKNDKWIKRVEQSLFLDAFIQCPSTGLLCVDQVGGLWGIESRSPLANPNALAWRILNLPNLNSNNFYNEKKILREELCRLSRVWAKNAPKKQGFSGYPNEILDKTTLKIYAQNLAEILNINYQDLEKNIGKRDFDWKIFNLGEFINKNKKIINL